MTFCCFKLSIAIVPVSMIGALVLASCAIQPTSIAGEVPECPIAVQANSDSIPQLQCETIPDPDTGVQRSFMLSAADPRVQKFVQEANEKSALYDQGVSLTDTQIANDKLTDEMSADDVEASLHVPTPEQPLMKSINVAFAGDAAVNIDNIDNMAYNKRILSDNGICQYPEQLVERAISGNRLVKFPDGGSYFFNRFWVDPSHTVGKAQLAQAIKNLQAVPFGAMAAAMSANIPLPTDATSAVMYHDVNAPRKQILVIFDKSGCAEEIAILNPMGMFTTGPSVFLMMPNEFVLPLSD